MPSTLVAALLAFSLAAPVSSGPAAQHTVDPSSIRKVHLVFSNHYDAGFADYASSILNRYILGGEGTLGPPHPRNESVYYNSFLLSAASTAKYLKQHNTSKGAPRLRYMTQAYIASYFADCIPIDQPLAYPHPPGEEPVHCPNETQLKTFVDAVEAGDIFWHAFPHNAEPELMDQSFFGWGIKFTQELAARLKAPSVPSVLSLRDVPGLTRAAVPILAAEGAIGISVGVNDGSPPPVVPSVDACYIRGERQVRTPFVWLDISTNSSVIADFHPGGYGGILPVNPDEGVPYYSRDGLYCDCIGVHGLDEVLCYAWKGDNYGPANAGQVEENFQKFYEAFPQATEVVASTLGEFWAILSDFHDRNPGSLPVIESEIGDTWMYGALSDPLKLATMRYMMRSRATATASWEPGLAEFSRFLLKLPEHTWGSCGSAHMHISNPTTVWTSKQLLGAIQEGKDPFYSVVLTTWIEQRAFMHLARQALGSNSTLGAALDEDRSALIATPPTAESLISKGYTRFSPTEMKGKMFDLGRVVLSFNNQGAVSHLYDKANGKAWASDAHPLFRLMYRSHTYAEARDYSSIYKYDHGGRYPHRTPSGIPYPGMNKTKTVGKRWFPTLVGGFSKQQSIVLELTLPKDPADLGYGIPVGAWLRFDLPDHRDSDSDCLFRAELVWEGKTPTRLKESIWLEMRPELNGEESSLWLEKMGSLVNAADVVCKGGAALHGIDPNGGVVLETSRDGKVDSLRIVSLDAGIVTPGSNTSPWNFTAYDVVPVNPEDGFAFGLYANLYAVNYPMWYPFRESDSHNRFRFTVSSGSGRPRSVVS